MPGTVVWPDFLRNIGLVSKIKAQQKQGGITALLKVRRGLRGDADAIFQ